MRRPVVERLQVVVAEPPSDELLIAALVRLIVGGEPEPAAKQEEDPKD
jgi:hypothetical protein